MNKKKIESSESDNLSLSQESEKNERPASQRRNMTLDTLEKKKSTEISETIRTRNKSKQEIEERVSHSRQSKQGLKDLLNWEKGIESDSQEIKTVIPPMISQQKTPVSNNKVSKDEKLILRANFEKLLFNKLNKEGLNIKGGNNLNEIYNLVNTGLDTYLRNLIEKLINVSRARNVNLSLYSKFSENNPTFKIHTYNYEKMNNTSQPAVENVPYKDFSIIFTTNMKNTISRLEHYEELTAYKSKIEKISNYKTKIEELTTQQPNIDKKEKDNVTVKPVGRRHKRKNAAVMKNYKNVVAKTQKKNEMDRQKKDTQYTLATFLDNKPSISRTRDSVSGYRMDEAGSAVNDSNMIFESFTKMSEVSKSEVLINPETNNLNLVIYKSLNNADNLKVTTGAKRKITLKDLVFYLESQKRTPLQNIILHKAIIKMNQ